MATAVGVVDQSSPAPEITPDDHDMVLPDSCHARRRLSSRKPKPVGCQPKPPDRPAEDLDRSPTAAECYPRTAGRMRQDGLAISAGHPCVILASPMSDSGPMMDAPTGLGMAFAGLRCTGMV